MSLWPIVYCPDWITNCCGFTETKERIRRECQLARAQYQFYSPSLARLNQQHQFQQAGNYWPTAADGRFIAPNHLQPPHLQQSYILLTQPVIIANNPGHLDSMTLVQHAQAGLQVAQQQQQQPLLGATNAIVNSPLAAHSTYQLHQQTSRTPGPLPLMGIPQTSNHNTNSMIGQPSGIMSSHYAIYGHLQAPIASAPSTNFMPTTSLPAANRNHHHQQQQNAYSDAANHRAAMAMVNKELQQLQNQLRDPEPSVSLNSDTFKQLELIEKQVDLSADMELVERFGIVITRALDPYSLLPHLTETTLRKYNTYFLSNDDCVIRFIEIVKRPVQTLGLYIRRVQYENPSPLFAQQQANSSTRSGIVVTKIDTGGPIYNNRVLHVGDEIISINLIEIQAMSVDDVVTLLSIPKRLVLAIRTLKDRDQLLNTTTNTTNHQQDHLMRVVSIEDQIACSSNGELL